VHKRGAGAFTLTEMLIVLAVAAVLAVLAVPALRATLQSNRVDAMANQFVATLTLARSEAVKLGRPVNVCSVAGGGVTSFNWGSGGWNVTLDCSIGTSQPALQTVPAFTGALTAYGSVAQVSFTSTGALVGGGEADFIFCADGNNASYPMAQGVTVISSGRVRVADLQSGTSIPMRNDEQHTMACQQP
jgi:type IV fimbrial biogenesis protein FimT